MSETSAALIDQLVYIDNFINSASDDTPNLDVDGQLLLDLAAFADESFIFPDEEKPNRPDDGNDFLDIPGSSSLHNQNWFDEHPVHHATNDNYGQNNNHTENHDPNSNSVGQNGHEDPLSNPGLGQRALGSLNERTKLAKLHRMNQYGNSEVPEAPSESRLLEPALPNLAGVPKFPVPPGAKTSLQQAGLSHNQIDLLSALIAQHQNSLGNTIPDEEENVDEDFHNPPDSAVTYAIAPTLASHANVETPGSMSNYTSSSGGNSGLSTPRLGRGSVSAEGSVNDLDKRKRNTAASARFRIKKKLKEKEMETKIDQLDDMIKRFELKIGELEMENRLLKNLIIEKGNRNSERELKLLKEKVRHGK